MIIRVRLELFNDFEPPMVGGNEDPEIPDETAVGDKTAMFCVDPRVFNSAEALAQLMPAMANIATQLMGEQQPKIIIPD